MAWDHLVEPLDEYALSVPQSDSTAPELFLPQTISQLSAAFPVLRPPVIEGLIREGETAGIHAKSKVGKSWLAYYIGLNVTTGYHLWGKHRCIPGQSHVELSSLV